MKAFAIMYNNFFMRRLKYVHLKGCITCYLLYEQFCLYDIMKLINDMLQVMRTNLSNYN